MKKILKQLKYLDTWGCIFILVSLIIGIWWPINRRPFIELALFFILGLPLMFLPEVFLKKKLYMVKTIGERRKILDKGYTILIAILSFMMIFSPENVKFWLSALSTGYISALTIRLIYEEIKEDKRVRWVDFR